MSAAAAATLPSLRARLRRRVLVPLAIVGLLGGAALLTVSWVSTAQALDRSLLDDAHAIAVHVKVVNERLLLDLTERELGAALFDHRERMAYAVAGLDGTVVAGDARLAAATPAENGWAFAQQTLDGLALRSVTLRREGARPFVVTVAQTTQERTQWLARLALYALLPPLVLLPMLAWWLGRTISDEVAPLARLQRSVERRDSRDLSPLPPDGSSREVAGLSQALNALMGRVADGVAAQREFAGNVAHELRTPLAGIRALASYGLGRDEPAVWRAQLASIAASEARASRLVEQLLALAYADEARDGLALGPLRLDELVRETVLRHLPLADAEGVELGASGLEQPLQAWGHAALVEGALGNLIVNALRHGRPSDGGAACVSIDLEAVDESTVRLAVSDNGPGISAAERERLLQRWSSSASSGGLGLAIAARYAALMGGRLELGDGAGGGLTAVLWLRLRAALG